MSLLERVVAAETCAVIDCHRRRAPDAQVCREDLGELFANLLDRNADGTYRRRRALPARDLTDQLVAA